MDNGQRQELIVWALAASPDWSHDVGWLPAPDHVVVADGGAAIAGRLGLTPTIIVGDYDSCDPTSLALIETWREAGIEVRTYQHDTKWETDTELALLAALELNPTRIYILGATGGRLDHTLANVLLLTHPLLQEIDVRIVEERQEVFLAKKGRWNSIAGAPGDTVTLIPIGGDVNGVTLRGLRYPLDNQTLPVGRGRGVSNEISDDAALWFANGLLMVIVLHSKS